MLWMVSPTESVTETGPNGLIDCPSTMVWLGTIPEKIGRPARTSTWEVTAGAMPSEIEMPISVMVKPGTARSGSAVNCSASSAVVTAAGLAAAKVYVPGVGFARVTPGSDSDSNNAPLPDSVSVTVSAAATSGSVTVAAGNGLNGTFQ